MRTGLLFEIPATAPSLHTRIAEFKKAHGILTHRAPFRREDFPWLALIPFKGDEGKDVPTLMADSCRLYEEAGYCALGTGEVTAIRELCQLRGIACTI
jgi:hypothetical protein